MVVETVWKPSTVMAEEDVPLLIPDAPETLPEEFLPSVEASEPVHETEITDPWVSEYESGTSDVFDSQEAEVQEIFQEAEVQENFQEAEVQEIFEELPYAEEPVIQETVENPEPAGLKAETPSGGEWEWISPADAVDADHDEPEPVEDLPSEPPLPVSSGKQESTEFRPWMEILSGQPVGWLIADAALVLVGIISLAVSVIRLIRMRRRGKKRNGSHGGRPGGSRGDGETGDPIMCAILSGGFDPVPGEADKGDAG